MTWSAGFGAAVREAQASGRLVVQPRMGFSDPRRMRLGLAAVKSVPAATVGTITVDSYTRLAQHAEASAALAAGRPLNGYPIVAHDPRTTRGVLAGILADDFPVQVRHGSAHPQAIVSALGEVGLSATEGGPVSYCLPYGRTPLQTSVANWAEACELLADLRGPDCEPHLETFGGCLLGQLCPPSLLVAVSILEAVFFVQHGVRDVSLSYAQQTNANQDEQAIHALARLATELIDPAEWHIVVYAYMGRFPRTPAGASRLLSDAAQLAARTGAARLIVKTTVESLRIPTVAENVAALALAARSAATTTRRPHPVDDSETYLEARTLVETVLELDDDVGRGLVEAFRRGLLDVPYCLHPDNAGRSESRLEADGWLRWSRTGAMPISTRPIPPTISAAGPPPRRITSTDLLAALSSIEHRYDSRSTS